MESVKSEPQETSFLKRVLKMMNASVYILNLNPYKLEWINDSAHTRRGLGMSADKIMEHGKEVAQMFVKSEDFQESVTEAIQFAYKNPDEQWYGIFRVNHTSGDFRWIYATSVVFEKDEVGIPQKCIVTALDITDHLHTNESLGEALKESKQRRHIEVLKSLTKREIEIIRFLAKGLSTKEIANQLNRSFHTIETHRGNIKNKLGCKNVAEIAAMGYRMGLVV